MKNRSSFKRTALFLGSVGAVVGATWIYRDYRSWIKLGAGGLPSNFGGWIRTTLWRFKMRNPFSIEPLLPMIGGVDDVDTLSGLEARMGDRPTIDPHPVPERQIDQLSPPDVHRRLAAVFEEAVRRNSNRVRYVTSHFERHIDAITLLSQLNSDPVEGASKGEIAHIHATEGSMHMILSPSDAKTAIEAGWAERHGLAGVALGIPLTYMMVYAPRSEEEVTIVERLLSAALRYMVGPDAGAGG